MVRLTGLVLGVSASCHLALPQCGYAAAGLPDAEIFSLQFDLSIAALSILGIPRRSEVSDPYACGYYPTWEKLFFRKLKMSFFQHM